MFEIWESAEAWTLGPGLGLGSLQNDVVSFLLENSKDKVVVLDAHALWIVKDTKEAKTLSDVIGRCDKRNQIILTPNEKELQFLLERFVDPTIKLQDVSEMKTQALALLKGQEAIEIRSKEEVLQKIPGLQLVYKLLEGLENTHLLMKGMVDIIVSKDDVGLVSIHASPKRCGGQGDMLAGLSSLYGLWSYRLEQKMTKGLILASSIIRTASNEAFKQHKLSTTPQKIIEPYLSRVISAILDK